MSREQRLVFANIGVNNLFLLVDDWHFVVVGFLEALRVHGGQIGNKVGHLEASNCIVTKETTKGVFMNFIVFFGGLCRFFAATQH